MTNQNGDDLRLRRHFVEKKQIIRIYSNSFVYIRKKKNTHSFVCIRIHSYILEKSTNSFVYIRIYSYIIEKKKNTNLFVYIRIHLYILHKKHQFTRIYSNSFVYIRKKNNLFVYIRIHSYVFGKINVQIWRYFCF